MGCAIPRNTLIVEDHADCANSLAVLLTLLGFDPVVARDGLEAVMIADRLHPDVIFLDLALPKMHGYDVCRQIRATDWGKSIAVIALTGFGQMADREGSSDAGIDVHLLKPARSEDLLGAIYTAVAMGHSGAARGT